MTRTRAVVQTVAVFGVLIAWVVGSETLGVGLLAKFPMAPLVHAMVTGLLALLVVFVATAGDDDRWASLGLKRPALMPTLLFTALGAMGAYIASGLVSGAYVLATGGASAIAQKAQALSALGNVPLWTIAPIALFAGFYEEVVFRGFLLDRLYVVFGHRPGGPPSRGMALAILVSSALFATGHLYQGTLGLLQTFTAGACFALVASIRRSLWPSIFAHAAIDLFGLVMLHVLKPTIDKMLEGQGVHL